jgi:nicotinamide-nucleotide amidase
MNSTLINIGDELLIGQVVNTNAAKMAQMLGAAGIEVTQVLTIGDEPAAIRDTLRDCLKISDIVIITGGLGPTKDDLTKQVLCNFFHSELYENEEALDNVRKRMAAFGRELTDINRQQAWVPRCCTVLNNPLGTAPGMWFDVAGTPHPKVVISLPGVPFEMEGLMRESVIPRLRERFATGHIIHKTLIVQGIGESFLSDLIEPWELALPDCLSLAYLPQPGLTRLRLTAHGNDADALQTAIDTALAQLRPIAGSYITCEGFDTLPAFIAHTMTEAGLTLATAESCTGGALSAQLTALAGASNYFVGGIVSYSNEVKESVLHVPHDILATHGAVSEPTAIHMAEGVRRQLHADYGIATTGIAGPGGGSPEKPVGTVWTAVATPSGTVTQKLSIPRRRAQVIEGACQQILGLLAKCLKEGK